MPNLIESVEHKNSHATEKLSDTEELVHERYTSKYMPLIKAEALKNKHGHKTFGYAEVPIRKPKEFLRKNSRITPPRPVVEQCHGKGVSKPQEPVPKHVVPRKPSAREKNFRVDNIVNAMRARGRQPVARCVVRRRGDAHLLEPSGLVPRFVFKKDYGQMPKYLQKRLRECQKQQKAEDEGNDPAETATRAMSEKERTDLIRDLKKNWEETETMYQRLPLIIDTPSMFRRKVMLEKKLKQLEDHISFIERHEQIYIYDDTEST